MNNTRCVIENTLSYDGQCYCSQGYYGEKCEHVITWYRPFLIFLYVVTTLSMIVSTFWLIMKFYIVKKQLNLAIISLASSSLGNLIKIIYLWMPSKIVYDVYNIDNEPNRIIFNYISLGFEIIATALLVVFWYELLRSRMKLKFSKTTKILAIIFSGLMIFGLVPGLWILHTTKSVFGLVLVVLPIFIIIIYLVIMTVLIILLNKEQLSEINLAKKEWVVRHLIALSGFWLLFIIGLLMILSDSNTLKIVSAVILIISYIGVSCSIAAALDFNYNAIRFLYKLENATEKSSG